MFLAVSRFGALRLILFHLHLPVSAFFYSNPVCPSQSLPFRGRCANNFIFTYPSLLFFTPILFVPRRVSRFGDSAQTISSSLTRLCFFLLQSCASLRGPEAGDSDEKRTFLLPSTIDYRSKSIDRQVGRPDGTIILFVPRRVSRFGDSAQTISSSLTGLCFFLLQSCASLRGHEAGDYDGKRTFLLPSTIELSK